MQYALIVFVTDYATSFLHVMHFLTVSLQNEMRWYVTLPEVLIFLFLNPIAPAINCALWMIFRILEKEKMIKHYTFLSKLTCLINGTFESGLGYLPGGHLPPPEFGHFPPPKKNICQEDNCHPQFFFFFFWRTFLGFFDLQLMEDIKDGKEEVLDEVVMEHIK